MNVVMLYGICATALVGLGLFGLVVNPEPLRKILALNLLGTGMFMLFGAIARRGAAAGLDSDPVPQAMIITAIVVAFSATAVATALLLRLAGEPDGDALDLDTKPPQDGADR
jgi:multicomponent Na+:H+ antiporter subunit C